MAAFDLGASEARAQKRFEDARRTEGNGALQSSRHAVPRYSVKDVPNEVREALYNLEAEANPTLEVPGDQLVFYCFNYGRPRAISFAAGLPKLCLERAAARPGWRPQSRALLRAVMKYRGIV